MKAEGEMRDLFGTDEDGDNAGGKKVEKNVRPAPDSILRGDFPGLKARASIQKVQGFPKVVDWDGVGDTEARMEEKHTFVAVIDVGIHCGGYADEKKDADGEGKAGRPWGTLCSGRGEKGEGVGRRRRGSPAELVL